jgi:hypothetical protein
MGFAKAVAKPPGSRRTAALAAWVQSLYASEAEMPVLVGGAAVELYTGGAYVTGDLDFVGQVPPEVAVALEAAGFQKRGRHWVHEGCQIFLEFPSFSLESGAEKAILIVGRQRILTLRIEDILLDRLRSLVVWKYKEDGLNAFRLAWIHRNSINWELLNLKADDANLHVAIRSLRNLVSNSRARRPEDRAVTDWLDEIGR